jgi:hypothetical protein
VSELTTHRQASYRFTLLDGDDREVGALEGVTGGSVTLSATTRLRGEGELQVTDLGQMVDWQTARVRVDYVMRTAQGDREWPVGVFMVAAPTVEHSGAGASRRVSLLGKLKILDEDMVEQTYSVPAGTVVTSRVEELVRSAGEDRVAVTGSEAVTASMMTWPPGTPKLTICNDLLDSVNYWALWVDGSGQFRVEPYTRPVARPRVWEFAEGAVAIHLPAWSEDQDIASVPNRVVLVGQGDAAGEALVGVATNEDPASPYSYQSRGRWVTHTEEGVEADSQATLTGLAQRKLVDLSTPASTLSISHMPIPLNPNEAVSFHSQGRVVSRGIVQTVKYDLTPTAMCTTELLEVVDV